MSFGRRYKLTIGEPTKSGILIKDLNIVFTIAKSDGSDERSSGTATIKVYNLSSTSINRLQKDDAILLQVGYKTDAAEPLVLFTGDVLSVSSIKVGGQLVTTLICQEGYVPKRQGYTSRSFTGGDNAPTVGDIIREIVTLDLGLPVAQLNNGDLGDSAGIHKKFQQNTTYVGGSANVLNILTKNHNLTWIVRDGSVYVYPINGSTKGIYVTKLSAATGMIGSPERLITNANRLKDDKDLKQGYKVRVLMNPAITLGDLVVLDSPYVKTKEVFRISKINVKGEFEGSDWTMMLQLLEGAK